MKMKKSSLSFVLMLILGLIPLIAGVFSSMSLQEGVPYEAASAVVDTVAPSEEEAPEAAPPDIDEEVYAARAAEHRRMMQEQAIVRAPASEDFSSESPADMQELEIPIDEPPVQAVVEPEVVEEAPPEEVYMTTSSAPSEKEFVEVVNDWLGPIGAINSMLLGWAGFWFRQREGKSSTENIDVELAKMKLPDKFALLLKAIKNKKEWNRLRLRMNDRWSIYGATHTAIYPEVVGRPVQHVTRLNTPIDAIMAVLDQTARWSVNTRPLFLVDVAWSKGQVNSVDETVNGQINHRDFDFSEAEVSRHYEGPKELLADLEINEHAIYLAFINRENGMEYTVLFKHGFIPCSLLEWEDFLAQFKHRYGVTLKGYELTDIVAFHKPVNKGNTVNAEDDASFIQGS